MITIAKENYKPYNTFPNADKKAILYLNLFPDDLMDKVAERKKSKDNSLTCISIGLCQMTGKIFLPRENSGTCVCVVLQNDTFRYSQKSNISSIPLIKGSVLFLGTSFRKKWKCVLPESSVVLYDVNYLPDIYSTIEGRLKYRQKVMESLAFLKAKPVWKQCPQCNLALEMVGAGCYGNVSKSDKDGHIFAVKIAGLNNNKKAYDLNSSSWHEEYYLKNVISPLVEKGVCPNLPLFYDSFVCDKCSLKLDDKTVDCPTVTIVTELANGILKTFLKEKRTEKEIYNSLFQVMAGLHAIQMHGQIMNFDVKKENVLYYDINPGGCWHYKILGRDFYVPNLGKLFVLNDFGTARTMDPRFAVYKSKKDKTFRLGSRFAVIYNNKFVPIQAASKEKDVRIKTIEWEDGSTSRGAEFRMRRDKSILNVSIKIPEYVNEMLESQKIDDEGFFKRPDIIPPFEFYNDTQDAIRMFIGGKRTTQRGFHKEMNIPKRLKEKLEPFIVKKDASPFDGKFSSRPENVLAGYFIVSFFSEKYKNPQGEILAHYEI